MMEERGKENIAGHQQAIAIIPLIKPKMTS